MPEINQQTKDEKPQVAAILQPTALQRAFWIYSNGSGDSDPGILVVRFTVNGNLEQLRLQQAWQNTIAQHDMLRATINPDKHQEPLLVIRDSLPQQINFLAPGITPDVNIELSKTPTHRLFCHKASAEHHHFIWHCHHALLDGWSAQTVLSNFLRNYVNLSDGSAQSLTTDNYVAIHKDLQNNDTARALEFWRKDLDGFTHPQLLTHVSTAANRLSRYCHEQQLLTASDAQRLSQLCLADKVTTAAAAHAIWALYLRQLCAHDDVVIGTAVSGRPPSIAHIESVVGCFATVAPVRATFSDNDTFQSQLKTLNQRLFEATEHQYVGILPILEQAHPACRSKLFDSLLVVENIPVAIHHKNDSTSTQPTLSGYSSDIVSAYPLTVTIIPGTTWTIRCDYDSGRFTEDWIRNMQRDIGTLLRLCTEEWSRPLAAVSARIPENFTDHPDRRALNFRNTQVVQIESVFGNLQGPRNQTELDMIALWEELLHLRPISMQDRFFDIGGNSLQAIRLIERVQRQFNQRIPASLFLSNPTPADCVEHFGELDKKTSIKSLVALKTSGSRAPIFCLHAGGGHAMFYREFANALDSEQPCYAIQPRGIDGLEPPISDVKEMASHYLTEIQSLQGDGPYHLLCYCFGGALMLEMAQQLQARGKKVGHLIVADAPAPIPVSHPMANLPWKAYLTYEFIVQRRWDLLANAARALRRKKQFSLNRDLATTTTEEDQPRVLEQVQRACVTGFNNYRAKPTTLSVIFLNASHSLHKSSRAVFMRNWKKLVPNRQEYDLSGKHQNIFDQPSVIETAKVISSILQSESVNQVVTEEYFTTDIETVRT